MIQNDCILNNVRIIAKRKGIKLSTFAKDLGISQGELSKILGGERRDYMKYFPVFVKILHVNPSELLEEAEAKTISTMNNIAGGVNLLLEIISVKNRREQNLLTRN
jgi:transcriptional regulator with XRE-family HTH domain